MKRIVIISIFLTLLLVIGCIVGKRVKSNENIDYKEGIYNDKDWYFNNYSVNKICIPDKDAAVKIASAILEGFQKDGYYVNYVAQEVFYDTQDKIWIISFWEDKCIDYNGGDICMALKAEDSQVIGMWGGE